MARKVSTRVVLNRRALDAMQAGYVDGMEAVGQAWVEQVHPPDAAPFGKGLVQTPNYGVWAHGKKVAGSAPKPRAVKVRQLGIVLIAGVDFPGRFQVFGTVHQAPNPEWFVGPMLRVLPNSGQYIKPKVRDRLRAVR